MESVLIGFSAGVDSTFLAAEARRVLGRDNMAVATSCSPSLPRRELEEARALAEALDLRLLTLQSSEMEDERFTANPPNRCYYCKHALFSELKTIAEEHGFEHVADGTNADDEDDFRPGMVACQELGIRQPLREAGLTKDDIRTLSAEMGLPTASKPASACLASRFPYGERITEEKLNRVERAEEALRRKGFVHFRVRSHGDIARIELGPREDLHRLLDSSVRTQITRELQAIGYQYVALDLEGYRTGSMNEVLIPVADAREAEQTNGD